MAVGKTLSCAFVQVTVLRRKAALLPAWVREWSWHGRVPGKGRGHLTISGRREPGRGSLESVKLCQVLGQPELSLRQEQGEAASGLSASSGDYSREFCLSPDKLAPRTKINTLHTHIHTHTTTYKTNKRKPTTMDHP